jgi:hypothetical protein
VVVLVVVEAAAELQIKAGTLAVFLSIFDLWFIHSIADSQEAEKEKSGMVETGKMAKLLMLCLRIRFLLLVVLVVLVVVAELIL